MYLGFSFLPYRLRRSVCLTQRYARTIWYYVRTPPTDTLWTQTYDSYQWYKGGVAIAGATKQYLVVGNSHHYESVGVEATLDGCSEKSLTVVVGAWAFIAPTIEFFGKFVNTGGELLVCIGDTIHLQVKDSSVNIQWSKNLKPIPGATQRKFILTSSKVTAVNEYTFYASPSICPGFRQNLGFNLHIKFIDCDTDIGSKIGQNSEVSIYPNPSNGMVNISSGQRVGSNYFLIDQLGRVLKSGRLSSKDEHIDIGDLPSGIYSLKIIGEESSAFQVIKK